MHCSHLEVINLCHSFVILGENKIGNEGVKHISKGNWKHLKMIGLGIN